MGVVNPVVGSFFRNKVAFGSYERLKMAKKCCYLCEVSEFGRLVGTFPPVIKCCEEGGVIKNPNIWPYAKVMADLTFRGSSVDFLRIVDFGYKRVLELWGVGI